MIKSLHIRDFKSFIVVAPDGSMTVTETITVNSTGQEIRRGIIRDFPTTYKDRLGTCGIELSSPHSGAADEVTGFRLVRELEGGA